MTGTKEDYIRYRIDKSKQTLRDAEILIEQQRWNSAINRLYYASYYAVHALLQKYDIICKTHSGTKSKFFQEFVRTGKVEREFGALYSDLLDWRQEGDYADFIEFDKKTVEPLPEKVKRLIDIVESFL